MTIFIRYKTILATQPPFNNTRRIRRALLKKLNIIMNLDFNFSFPYTPHVLPLTNIKSRVLVGGSADLGASQLTVKDGDILQVIGQYHGEKIYREQV